MKLKLRNIEHAFTQMTHILRGAKYGAQYLSSQTEFQITRLNFSFESIFRSTHFLNTAFNGSTYIRDTKRQNFDDFVDLRFLPPLNREVPLE